MIDIKKIRENPNKVREALLKRVNEVSFDDLLKWDSERRNLIEKAENLRAKRNNSSMEISVLKKNGKNVTDIIEKTKCLGRDIKVLDEKKKNLDKNIFDFLSALPNIPDEDVVAGGKENNEVLYVRGQKKKFNFKIKNHVELCESLHLIDYKRGVKLSGNGHWIYKDVGAKLEWALINFFINEHIKDGYEFLLMPHILNYECGFVAGQFPKYEKEDYWIECQTDEYKGKFLLPTAETALVNYHRNEILSENELPKKYFSYTPCFRREAGSARTEERGMIRGHQFNKVEMVQYAHPEHSRESFNELVYKAENLVQKLGLHYRLSKLAAADCSSTMARTYDIEVWLPSVDIYKEVSSVSNSNDYQSRRGNIKFISNNGEIKFLHTLNASGLATSRIIPAIVEQNQQEDGSVVVPEVLQEYMGIEMIKPI